MEYQFQITEVKWTVMNSFLIFHKCKTTLRNRLNDAGLSTLMRISVEGPD